LGVRRAMTVADLRAWQAAMGFTYESAAEALGMSPFGLCQVCPRCLPPTTGARRWPVQPLRRGCKHGRRPPESLAQIQHPAQWLGQSPPNFPPITVKKSMNMRKYNPGSGHQSSVSACAPIAQNHTNQWVGAQWIEALRSGMECAGCRCSCPSWPAITRQGRCHRPWPADRCHLAEVRRKAAPERPASPLTHSLAQHVVVPSIRAAKAGP